MRLLIGDKIIDSEDEPVTALFSEGERFALQAMLEKDHDIFHADREDGWPEPLRQAAVERLLADDDTEEGN